MSENITVGKIFQLTSGNMDKEYNPFAGKALNRCTLHGNIIYFECAKCPICDVRKEAPDDRCK